MTSRELFQWYFSCTTWHTTIYDNKISINRNMVDVTKSMFMIRILFQMVFLSLGYILLQFNLEDINSAPRKYEKLTEMLTIKKAVKTS